MRMTFDRSADAAFIYLADETLAGAIERTEVCDVEFNGAAIILAIGVDGRLFGIEILGATKIIDPAVLEAAGRDSPGNTGNIDRTCLT